MVIPIPPPQPRFEPIHSRNTVPDIVIHPPPRRQSPPPAPPPPPQQPAFLPSIPLNYRIRGIRRRRLIKERLIQGMLTWYGLTLVMRQKLQNQNQQLEDTRHEWISMFKEKLEEVRKADATTSLDNICIYRIPNSLKENNMKCYLPQTVSIGPYHHGNEQLLPMDHHKWRAVTMVLKRTNHSIEKYIDAMKELEARARACYEGHIDMSSNMFTQMLVLDGCFVLELFRGDYEGFQKLGYDPNDSVFARRGSMHSIQRDVIMLENQLPLFVLNRLLELQLGPQNQTGLVAKLAIRFLNPLMPTDMPLTTIENSQGYIFSLFFNPTADKKMKEIHCLEIFHRSLLGLSLMPEPRLSRRRWSSGNRVVDKRQQQLIYCVTELRKAGIKFKRRHTDRFWDIKFLNGCLEIPKLLIHDGTKSLFSNLIAFEQCHIDSSNDITSYIIFMDNLIDTAEDVRHLHHCGIIEHWLGSDSEAANVFNQLCQEVALELDDTYLSKLSNQVNIHYNRRWNVTKVILKHKYYNTAVILLLLTIFQSFFTAYPFFKPPTP